MSDLELSFDQLGRACADAATAAIESERLTVTAKIQHLIDTANKIGTNKLTIEGLEIALREVQNV